MRRPFGTARAPFGVLALLGLLAWAIPAAAQTTGTITGKVTEKGGKDAVAYAQVIVLGTKLGAQTAEDGSFTIRNVPAGTHQVRAQQLGIAPVTKYEWTARINHVMRGL